MNSKLLTSIYNGTINCTWFGKKILTYYNIQPGTFDQSMIPDEIIIVGRGVFSICLGFLIGLTNYSILLVYYSILHWWFGTYEGGRKHCFDSRGEATVSPLTWGPERNVETECWTRFWKLFQGSHRGCAWPRRTEGEYASCRRRVIIWAVLYLSVATSVGFVVAAGFAFWTARLIPSASSGGNCVGHFIVRTNVLKSAICAGRAHPW